MRCEPWMDYTPVPRKTPLQLAQADMRYWADRKRDLLAEMTEAEKEFGLAMARVEKADADERTAAHLRKRG